MGTDLEISRSLDGYVLIIEGPDLVAKKFTESVTRMAVSNYKSTVKEYNPLRLPFMAGGNGRYEIWCMLNEATACIMPSSGKWTVHTAFTEEELKGQ